MAVGTVAMLYRRAGYCTVIPPTLPRQFEPHPLTGRRDCLPDMCSQHEPCHSLHPQHAIHTGFVLQTTLLQSIVTARVESGP